MQFRSIRLAAVLAFCAVWGASAGVAEADLQVRLQAGLKTRLHVPTLRQTLDKYCAGLPQRAREDLGDRRRRGA